MDSVISVFTSYRRPDLNLELGTCFDSTRLVVVDL